MSTNPANDTCPQHGDTPDPDNCPWCAEDEWCYAHMRREPMTDDAIACGECWHAFPNEQAIIDDHNALAKELDLTPVTSVGQVFACPHCAHDF